jgi:hypothetical protein
MVIASVEIDRAGAVGRYLAIGASPHGAHPWRHGAELGGREKIGGKMSLFETALALKVSAE